MFLPPTKDYKNILIIRANAVSDFRMDLLHRYLVRQNIHADIITQVPFHTASQYDIIICCRPGQSMLEYLKIAMLGGKRVIMDMDDDFNTVPKHNPAYPYTGAGNPNYLNELRKVISSPDLLMTYASPILADRYKKDGIIIPNCWDEENEGWALPKHQHPGRVTVGWSGTTTHREDFKLVEPTLKKLLLEYDNLDIVISLDDQIYGSFFETAEERKTYLPGVPYPDYPRTFHWFDILIVPLRDTIFNRAKSDIKLVECGASRTAWIASDMPVYREWGEGGLLVENNDWETPLRQLIENETIRKELTEKGHDKSLTRTSEEYCQKWMAVIEKVWQE